MRPIIPMEVAIPTRGSEVLATCLASLLAQTALPKKLSIRFDTVPRLSFQLAQLLECLRLCGVIVNLTICSKPEGIAAKRDALLLGSGDYRMLVFLDDDVVLTGSSLHDLTNLTLPDDTLGFVCGNKRDITNTRNYGDFSTEPIEVHEGMPSTNLYYEKEPLYPFRTTALDTGYAMLFLPAVKPLVLRDHNPVRFNAFKDGFNCGGEDNLFGVRLIEEGLTGWCNPRAVAYHIDKPVSTFSEPAARCEAVLRSAQLLGVDPKQTKDLFPWLKRK